MITDRNGIKQINTDIQINDFDKRTRVQLFNLFNKVYDDIFCMTIDIRKIIDDDEFQKTKYNSYDIHNIFNNLFEREYVGCRFINKLISPITDEIELNSITEAIQNENDIVKEHFEKAHGLLEIVTV